MNSFLDTPIEYLKGIGPIKAQVLEKELRIATFKDLLYFFPYRYIDTSKIHTVNSITPHMDIIQMRGVVTNFQIEGIGARKRLTALFVDRTGAIELVWFQGISYVEKNIHEGVMYNLIGKISVFNNKFNIAHPELEIFDASSKSTNTTMTPLYSSTEKLKAKGITNKSIGKLTKTLLELYNNQPREEYLPNYLIENQQLLSLHEALNQIHFPENEFIRAKAVYRIKYQELLVAQLKINKLKLNNKKIQGFVFGKVGDYFNQFYHELLPFPLTNAQKRVIKDVRNDTLSGYHMNRLIQGDVGSGKTIVALLSMLIGKDNGFQSCMMAPTEILARQHYEGIKELLHKSDIAIELLTGSIKGKERKRILESLAEGKIDIIVGTHALVEDKVIFKNLGLSIIDEQHRFGVEQRSKLWKKNVLPPHILVMTATPIPRTLAMTLYGDLDTSVIDELPPGRKPIQTIHRNEMYRSQIMEFARSEIQSGRQVYIVYPLINESEKLDYENLMQGYEQVKMYFPEPNYKIAMVHGKQDKETKDSNMRKFVSGYAHILVSTTVIEVGVNVPNASIMIIESAERFGLSQLHQLRGRVGRGAEKSYCILLTTDKISQDSKQRMAIMVQTQDGFKISEEDLKMRGPGDIYGTKQSGAALDFKLADIIHDTELITLTKQHVEWILQTDPDLVKPNNMLLHKLLQFYSNNNKGIKWDRIS